MLLHPCVTTLRLQNEQYIPHIRKDYTSTGVDPLMCMLRSIYFRMYGMFVVVYP